MTISLKNKTLLVVCCLCYFYSFAQQKTDSIAFKQVDAYLKVQNKAKALQLALIKLDSVKGIKDTIWQIKWNSKIGKIFRDNNIEKAKHYFFEAKQLSVACKDSLLLANLYFDIGSLYMLQFSNDTYKAQDINVSIHKKDTALVYFKKILNHFKNIRGTDAVVAKTYANLTGLYSYTGKQKEVAELAKKAILYFKKRKDTIGIVGVKSNLGINQLYQGQFKKAEQNYLEALPYLKDTSNLRILNMKSINFDNLSQVYEAQKKYQLSREYLQKSQKLRIIYLDKIKAKELLEIEYKYNLDVAIAKESEKIIEEKSKKQKAQLWLFILSLLGVSGLLMTLILYRNNRMKTIKKELSYQKNIQSLQQQNQNKVVSATLDGRLKERQQISEVLHDSVSALLSSANMHLQVVKRKCDSGIVEITKTQQILEETLDKIRNLSQQLVPSVLIKFGLIEAVENLCEKYSNTDMLFQLDCTNKTTLFDSNLELKVYNIIQECFSNIIKHSKATQASISLEIVNNQLEIDIFDNGVGFDVTNISNQKGMGLHQIRARVATLNGTLKIISTPEKFTKISMQIPINKNYL